MTRRREIEYVRPERLKPAPYNPRRIGPQALRRLAGLLDRHGFVDPVIARREDGLIIAGHQRLKANALRRRPAREVPVLFLRGVSDARAKALNIALNNAQAQGTFDPPGLAELLKELSAAEPDLPAATGFAESDLTDILSELDEMPQAQADVELPEILQVVVEVATEQQQREVYERLTGEGLKCRLLTL